jgi:NTE family protein
MTIQPLPSVETRRPPPEPGDLALVLTGGGARAAYQVGFLRCLSRHLPTARIPIITGVSAGAINAVFLASHRGGITEAVEVLHDLWSHLTPQRIYQVGTMPLLGNAVRWAARLISGGSRHMPEARSFLDPTPLRSLLSRSLVTIDGEVQGIEENLREGRFKALALSTLDYSTGKTIAWIQGRDLEPWERPFRRGIKTRINLDHILASSALPLVFPAVRLGNGWHGDGGIRLLTPLAPAIHLGANRILAISTRYGRSRTEADQPMTFGYPPPAQVAGTMLNAVFLDAIDQDVRNLERINRLLATTEPPHPEGLRPIRILVLRPSSDLGRLAGKYETHLPGALRFMTRGLGTRQTSSPDFLSLLMFQPDYLRELIAIGEADAESQLGEIHSLFADDQPPASASPVT